MTHHFLTASVSMTAPLLRASTLAALVALSGCEALGSAAAPRRAPAGPAVAAVDADALVYPDLPAVEAPAVRRVTLSNGLVVLLSEDRTLPLVQATARIGAGSLLDPADEVGLADIAAETMRTGGAGSLSPDELNLALESVGASVEAGAGGDATTVGMRALSETLDTVLPLYAAVVTAPRFEAEQVALAKAQQAGAIARRNDDPAGVAGREFARALYGPDSPYGRTPEVWTVDAVSPADARAWHARYVVPANTLMAVWGDFETDDMVARLEAAFAGWTTPAGFAPPETPQPEAQTGRRVLLVDRDDVNQSTIRIGHPGVIRRDDPDYPAVVVMNEILGGGFPSRLYRTVRTDLGLAYGVSGGYSAGYVTPGAFVAGTATRSDATARATEAVLDVTRSLLTTPPSPAELAQAKQSYLNAFVFNYDSRAEVLGRQLTYDAYGYAPTTLEDLRAGVEAVRAEDVTRVARRYLQPDSTLIVVVGDAAAFGDGLGRLGPVDTLDVTIPAVPPAGTAGSGGRTALAAVATALGGRAAFESIEALRTEGETTVAQGGETVTIGTTTTVRLPAGGRRAAVRSEQRLPAGTVTIVLGDADRVVTPAGVQDAPAALAEQVRAQLFLSLPYLLARLDDLTAETRASAAGTVLALRPPGAASEYRLTVGATGRPTEVATTQLTPQGTAEVVVRLEDYRAVETPEGPLALPFRYVQQVNGAAAGQTQLSSVTVNPAVEAGTFTAE